MKVLCITEFFPSTTDIDVHGGVEARVFYIANYLSRRHKVSVITSREQGKSGSRLPKLSVYRVGWLRDYIGSGQVVTRLVFIMAAIWKGLALDFDAVEGAGLASWLPAWVVGTIRGKKKTIVVADTVEAYASGAPFLLWGLQRFEGFLLSRKWDGVICISQTIKQKLVARREVKTQPTVIYCGVDAALAKKLQVPKSSFPTICCVSRLVGYKRIGDLITATVALRKHFPSLQVKIVGIGEELPRLKDLVQMNNLQKAVTFYGFIPSHRKVLQIIKSAHVFCLPSVVEGFGIVTIEALACGVPVVLPRLPIHEEVTQCQGTLLYEPENISALTQKLSLLLSNKKIYGKLQRQTKSVAKKYSWEVVGEQTEQYYENLCSN